MKRVIAAMAALILSVGCYAQDMIVKKDGSIIQAKVSEIGTSEVKYKKWSNQDGPSYIIAKSDVLAITYQNGEKETFESVTTSVSAVPAQHTSKILDSKTPENIAAIQAINNATLVINDNKLISKKKKNKTIALQYGISDNSTIQSDILTTKIEFCREAGYVSRGTTFHKYYKGEDYISFFGKPVLLITLVNNSDRLIYVDLANTFWSIGQYTEAYYVPTVQTTSSTSTSGGAFNLGGITNGLGFGGIVGSLANATTVGGSSGTTETNVVYSQRVISIPPHSSRDLSYKTIDYKNNPYYMRGYTKSGECYTYLDLGKKLYIGEEITYDETNSPFIFKFYTNVSFEANFDETFSSSVTFYCKKAIGVDGGSYKVKLKTLDISDNCLYSFGAN